MSFSLICLLTFLALTLILVPFSRNDMSKKLRSDYSQSIDKTVKSLDDILSSIYQIPYEFVENDDIGFYKLLSNNTLELYDASTELAKYRATNKNITYIFLSIDDIGKTIGGDSVFSNEMFGNNCFYFSDYTHDELFEIFSNSSKYHKKLLKSTSLYSHTGTSPIEVIPVVLSMPINDKLGFSFLVLLDENRIKQELSRGFVNSEIMIIDENDEVIASTYNYAINDITKISEVLKNDENLSLKEVNLEGKKCLITSASSKFNNMKCVVISDKNAIFSDINKSMLLIYLFLALLLLFMIFVVIFLAKWNYIPIQSICQFIGVDKDIKKMWQIDDTKEIQDAFSILSSVNNQLHKKLSISNLYVRDSALYRLIQGQYDNFDEIFEKCEYAGISLVHNNCCVVLFNYVDHANDIPTQKFHDQYKRHEIEFNFNIPVNNNYILAVLQYPQEVTDIVGITNEIYTDITSESQKPFNIVIGKLCNSLIDLPSSYLSVMNCNLPAELTDSGVFESVKLINQETLEGNSLIDLVKIALISQNTKKIETSIEQAVSFIKNNASRKDVIEPFYNEFSCMLLDKLDKFNIFSSGNLQHHIDKQYHSPEKSIAALKLVSTEIVSQISNTSSASKQIVMENVLLYIDESYLKRNFSLSLISQKFELSESAFSHMFKKNMNCTFINYINNLKIEQAKKLLKTTDKNIDEIAEFLCYSTASNFSRMFKNLTGNTPNGYRTDYNKKS